MQLTTIESTLLDPRFEAGVRDTLKHWPDVSPQGIDTTTRWLLAIRDELVSLAREIEDPEELVTTVAINYIELKSRWIALNTKINYQTFRKGSCQSELALRASAVSQLLASVESLLTQQDIDKITEFLSEPVRKAA